MAAPTSCSASNATSASDADIVLLRGLIRSRFHWGPFAPLVEQQWPERRLWQPELPGNGYAHQRRSPASISAMTDVIRDQVITSKPVVVIAISMGAMVACDWAKRFPTEVKELHLINTSFANMAKPWQRLQPKAVFALLRAARHWSTDPAALEHTVWQQTVQLGPLAEQDIDIISDWITFARQHPIKASNALRQMWAASRFRAPKSKPCQHTYIYASKQDALVDWQCSLAISQRWECSLLTHATAGHDLPLQDPGWLLHQIAQQSATLHNDQCATNTTATADSE
ncbi:alpha/beta hydrolase [Bacterioplanes sanyensis]|uniref:Alpha/beta hydrolase n=1 Tax=Bacterioplanes sanyensis TaxID=1249553 RepID=A0A222FKW2_9GAMM|nr:alpha/beta fold hydrolase [Bacterioplanes sanyensis]ASP39677.1 alpha/beta hydrolase [Bacterioplanes sanyensis]